MYDSELDLEHGKTFSSEDTSSFTAPDASLLSSFSGEDNSILQESPVLFHTFCSREKESSTWTEEPFVWMSPLTPDSTEHSHEEHAYAIEDYGQTLFASKSNGPVTAEKSTSRQHEQVRTRLAPCLYLGGLLMSIYLLHRITLVVLYPRWWLPSQKQVRNMRLEMLNAPLETSYTLRLKGGHLELLRQSIHHHTRCKRVHQVQIDWRDGQDTEVPDALLVHSSRKVRARAESETQAVLLLDEGINLSCEDMDKAFFEWQNDRTKLVGFLPYTEPDGYYSLVSDAAVFVHEEYLRAKPPSLDAACDHLALSAWNQAIHPNSAPIAMSSKVIFSAQTIRSSMLADTATRCHQSALYATGMVTMPKRNKIYVGRPLVLVAT